MLKAEKLEFIVVAPFIVVVPLTVKELNVVAKATSNVELKVVAFVTFNVELNVVAKATSNVELKVVAFVTFNVELNVVAFVTSTLL